MSLHTLLEAAEYLDSNNDFDERDDDDELIEDAVAANGYDKVSRCRKEGSRLKSSSPPPSSSLLYGGFGGSCSSSPPAMEIHDDPSISKSAAAATELALDLVDMEHKYLLETHDKRRVIGAGTREVHNKLEKNRRAHLKECFGILKGQLPLNDRKASNLNTLRFALRFIHTLKRKGKEYEQELTKLKEEKTISCDRLTALIKDLRTNREDIDVDHLLLNPIEVVCNSIRLDEDSHSTSTASECGDSSDTDDAMDVSPPPTPPSLSLDTIDNSIGVLPNPDRCFSNLQTYTVVDGKEKKLIAISDDAPSTSIIKKCDTFVPKNSCIVDQKSSDISCSVKSSTFIHSNDSISKRADNGVGQKEAVAQILVPVSIPTMKLSNDSKPNIGHPVSINNIPGHITVLRANGNTFALPGQVGSVPYAGILATHQQQQPTIQLVAQPQNGCVVTTSLCNPPPPQKFVINRPQNVRCVTSAQAVATTNASIRGNSALLGKPAPFTFTKFSIKQPNFCAASGGLNKAVVGNGAISQPQVSVMTMNSQPPGKGCSGMQILQQTLVQGVPATCANNSNMQVNVPIPIKSNSSGVSTSVTTTSILPQVTRLLPQTVTMPTMVPQTVTVVPRHPNMMTQMMQQNINGPVVSYGQLVNPITKILTSPLTVVSGNFTAASQTPHVLSNQAVHGKLITNQIPLRGVNQLPMINPQYLTTHCAEPLIMVSNVIQRTSTNDSAKPT